MKKLGYRNDPKYLFTLHVDTADGIVVIRAFEGDHVAWNPTHHRIDVEVRLNGREIFKRGQLYCGIPQCHSIDGIHAKENVMCLVSMKPGDTDPSYFDDYTSEQLMFARRVGEEISLRREMRYCDRNGNVRKEK